MSGFPTSNQRNTASTPPRSVSPVEYNSRPISPESNNPYRESTMSSTINNKNKKDQDARSDMSVQVADNNKNASQTSLGSSIKDEKKKNNKSRPKTTTFDLPEKDVEEKDLERNDTKVSALMKKDMKVKTRIRIAKCFLRCLNFGCSLVVLSLVASAFSIFFATRRLASRNNLNAWSPTSVLWPAVVTLSIACVSLVMSIVVMVSYWRGGHRKAEKAAIWFTAISIGGFLLMIILWGVVAGILTNARNNSNGADLWAWSCKDNTRKELFQGDVNYDLVCRQMDWSFVCAFIDISIEILAILLYAAAFWRFASKSKLRKSMDVRDNARKSVYLQKLRDGDEDVYRPENAEGDDGYKKPSHNEDDAEKGYGNTYYPPPPAPVHAGSMPIIDPNSGLAINPSTGEATKPNEYKPPGHAM